MNGGLMTYAHRRDAASGNVEVFFDTKPRTTASARAISSFDRA
jgi:hypothetical protein